jgi:hypothetical protein
MCVIHILENAPEPGKALSFKASNEGQASEPISRRSGTRPRAAFGQQIFDIWKAEWKPVVKPDRMDDDLRGETVALEMSRRDFACCNQMPTNSRQSRNPALPLQLLCSQSTSQLSFVLKMQM